jgi:hypothetical protein
MNRKELITLVIKSLRSPISYRAMLIVKNVSF